MVLQLLNHAFFQRSHNISVFPQIQTNIHVFNASLTFCGCDWHQTHLVTVKGQGNLCSCQWLIHRKSTECSWNECSPDLLTEWLLGNSCDFAVLGCCMLHLFLCDPSIEPSGNNTWSKFGRTAQLPLSCQCSSATHPREKVVRFYQHKVRFAAEKVTFLLMGTTTF